MNRRSFFGRLAAFALTGPTLLRVLALSGAGTTAVAIEGCNGTTVANDIVSWTPALQSTVATVGALVSALDPALALFVQAFIAAFNAAATLVIAQAKAYLANPTTTVLATLSQAAVTFQQTVNTQILAAAKIVTPASQQLALTALNGVATVINGIIALISTIKGNTVTAALAEVKDKVTLAEVKPYLDLDQAAHIIAKHNGSDRWPDDVAIARSQVDYGYAHLEAMGF
jgi:hypothetical protein